MTWLFAPLQRARATISRAADAMQLLTIRRILMVMFVVLVLFLAVIAAVEARWQCLLVGVLIQLVHVALLLAAAPLLVGLIRRIKARLVGRAGPPLMQPYRDLLRLARKQPVLAENASVVFRAAPLASFAATAAAAALVPSFALGMATAPVADLLVIAGLLTIARVALALAAMDVGTAFGGIGASREMSFAAFAEPALAAGLPDADAARRQHQPRSRSPACCATARSACGCRWASPLPPHWPSRWPRTAEFRWTTRRRIWNSAWSTRPWRWNTAAAIWH